MIKNYFTIALRNLWRSKGFSFINILGLAIGIATCLLIVLYVLHELSYDRYNEKADQIVRVTFKGKLNGESLTVALAAAPVAKTLKNDFPEVLEATRLRHNNSPFISYEDKTFKEKSLAYVDSNFFQVFSIPFLKGDPKTALIAPKSLVLTLATARKYFGHEDPIGKVLLVGSQKEAYQVTGLIDKVPSNSHFHMDLFGSLSTLEEAKQNFWFGINFNTYLVLPKGYDYHQLEAKLPQVVNNYMGPDVQRFMGVSLEEMRKKGDEVGLFLQPLTDIHLRSDYAFELEPGGDIRYVYIFAAIAVFVLLIACINFMNLSTAGAAKRAKEVGIRKVLGSVQSQLVRQFLLESILMTLLALLLGIGLMKLSLPLFNRLTGKELDFAWWTNPAVLLGLLLFGLLVGIISGSYPAFFLSSFRPIAVLKGKLTVGRESLGLRSALVVFQFFISIALMVCTVTVYQQLQYMQSKKLGYDTSQVLVIHDSYALGSNEEVLKKQLQAHPQVVNASISGYVPVGDSYNNNNLFQPEDNPDRNVAMRQYGVDHDYVPTLGMEMALGRNFSQDFPTDSSAAIINEAAVQLLGWGKDPLNKRLITLVDEKGTKRAFNVIGVVKDFHFESLHQKIGPLVMFLGNNSGSLLVKTNTRDIAGFLSALKTKWNGFSPKGPFAYSFLDERRDAVYQAEKTIGQTLSVFAGLTIFIACLGLFGLATFTAQQRIKEIGIRKVLGAGVTNLVLLLSGDFLKLVGIAFVIATPVAWWAMSQWLEDFAYRISIGWWVFAIAGLAALLIALFTVSYQAIKAALTNPVKNLRTE